MTYLIKLKATEYIIQNDRVTFVKKQELFRNEYSIENIDGIIDSLIDAPAKWVENPMGKLYTFPTEMLSAMGEEIDESHEVWDDVFIDSL